MKDIDGDGDDGLNINLDFRDSQEKESGRNKSIVMQGENLEDIYGPNVNLEPVGGLMEEDAKPLRPMAKIEDFMRQGP